ncbi:MAG TPA: hypothetical protein VNO84_16580 [Burkholderiaceae bacterium]|nr:hypothetical protein [Burkholderiaceae bacterium]
MRASDLSLTVRQRKLACVIDPALALGHPCGPGLALKLAQVFEPWLTRSFWQTLDASELLLRRLDRELPAPRRARVDPDALLGWLSLREATDAGSWTLHWVDENFTSSQVRDAADSDLVDRYEQLAAALEARMNSNPASWESGLDPVRGAMDTLSLSACLDGALVLTECPRGTPDTPWPVQALDRAGVPVDRLDPPSDDTLFAVERRLVRDALVTAGLVALAQRLPSLAAVHVLVDATGASDAAQEGTDPWSGARAWWYAL